MAQNLLHTSFDPLVRGSRLLRLRLKKCVCGCKILWSCLIVDPVGNSAWSFTVLPDHRTCKQWVVAFTLAAHYCSCVVFYYVFQYRFILQRDFSSRSDTERQIYSFPVIFWMEVVHWRCFCAICNRYIWNYPLF